MIVTAKSMNSSSTIWRKGGLQGPWCRYAGRSSDGNVACLFWLFYFLREVERKVIILEWRLQNLASIAAKKKNTKDLEWKEIQPVNAKGNQSWIFIGKTDAEAETPILWPSDGKKPIHLKRPLCWKRLKAGGKRDHRGWDGWMASLTRWTWVWVSSGSWWWTGKTGVLQSMGSQSQTRLSDWAELKLYYTTLFSFILCFSFWLLKITVHMTF